MCVGVVGGRINALLKTRSLAAIKTSKANASSFCSDVLSARRLAADGGVFVAVGKLQCRRFAPQNPPWCLCFLETSAPADSERGRSEASVSAARIGLAPRSAQMLSSEEDSDSSQPRVVLTTAPGRGGDTSGLTPYRAHAHKRY